MRVTQSAALDRKRRRKANRAQRKAGGQQFDLATEQKRSEHSVKLRATLAGMAAQGNASARQRKKGLNTVTHAKGQANLAGFWNQAEADRT